MSVLGVRLIEVRLGVRLIEVSVKRELTVAALHKNDKRI